MVRVAEFVLVPAPAEPPPPPLVSLEVGAIASGQTLADAMSGRVTLFFRCRGTTLSCELEPDVALDVARALQRAAVKAR